MKYLIWNVDCDDGSIKWKNEIQVDTLEVVHPLSSPAAATPASDGEYVYCYFPTFGLVCDNYKGDIIWKSPIDFYKAGNGSGSSPIIYKGKVIINHENLSKPRILVFDKRNGELLWEHQFPLSPLFNSMSWSTPAIWNDQVIVHRLNTIVGIDLISGKSIWQFDIGSTGCATPVIDNDILYVNSWMIRGNESIIGEVSDFQKLFEDIDIDNDGFLNKKEFQTTHPKGVTIHDRVIEGSHTSSKWVLYWYKLTPFDDDNDNRISENEWDDFMKLMADYANDGLVAIQLGDTGNITFTNQLWKINDNIAETPSVLIKDELIYMIENRGVLTCATKKTGKVVYTERLGTPGAYFSSPLYANGNIFLCSFNGIITIISEGKDIKIINQVDLDERIGASPVALNDKLYVRTISHLYAFQ